MNERMRPGKVRGVAKQFLVIAVVAGGCTMQEPLNATIDQSFAQQLSTDSRYMGKLVEKANSDGTGSIQIDLADPAQYRFVMNRLRAAGKTAENSPHLFERIQVMKNKALARANARGTNSAAAPTDWCASVLLLGKEVRSGTSITFEDAHAVVSCVGGAAYVYNDITASSSNLDDTENILVANAAGEDYSGGTAFDTVSISPVFNAVAGRVNKTDSFLIADDDFGNEQMTFSLVQSILVALPGSITFAHPVSHGVPQTNGNIQVCQLRGGANQCDYAVGSMNGASFADWTTSGGTYTGIAAVKVLSPKWIGDTANYFAFPAISPYAPDRVYLPMEGTVDAGSTATSSCIIKSIIGAEVNLVKTTTGGICTTTARFASSITVPPNSRTASFRTIGEFFNNGGVGSGDCSHSRIVNEAVKPQFSIKMSTDCGLKNPDGTPKLQLRVAAMAAGGGMSAFPHYIYWLNSCFAEGTSIRRANGSSTAVEAIKVGDKVLSDNKGTMLTVTGISHGGENEPLVGLRDDMGHELRLTSKHPIIKSSGEVVFASSIKKDDKVMTDRGTASIVSVTRIPYTGQVYNLKLGTPEEQLKVGKDGTTMFAGGFLVGDSVMQKEHDTARRPVAQLSKAWQRDYQNAVAGNPPMKRSLR